jgi:hypothetical protein
MKCCGEGERVDVAMEGERTAGEDDRLAARARVGLTEPGYLPSVGDGGLELTLLVSLSAPEDLLRDAGEEVVILVSI